MAEPSPTSVTDNAIASGGIDDYDADSAKAELGTNDTQSALRDNISKKGKNAYYYAHAHKATGPEWDGKIEPRLLSTSTSNLSSSDSCVVSSTLTSSKAELMSKSNITNYAFLNEETKVKIYIDLPDVGNCCQDSDIQLEYSDKSLCLTVKNYVPPTPVDKNDDDDDEMEVSDAAPTSDENEDNDKADNQVESRCLSFARLYGEIEKATYRKKADKLIVTLIKKDIKEWSSVIA